MPRVKHTGKATVVSLYPREISPRLPYGEYLIPAAEDCSKHQRSVCGDCLTHTTTTVEDRPQGMDVGFGKTVVNMIDAIDIADDIVRDNRAMFALEGETKPTQEQLNAARDSFIEYLKEAVAVSDGSWNRYHDSKLIPESARIGVNVLGLKREWLSDTSLKKQCDSCGEFVPVTVIRCKCGAVYDWQKAFKLGMLTPDQVEFARSEGLIPEAKRGPGRPPKVETATA